MLYFYSVRCFEKSFEFYVFIGLEIQLDCVHFSFVDVMF